MCISDRAKDTEKKGLAHQRILPAEVDDVIWDWILGLKRDLEALDNLGRTARFRKEV